MFFDDIENISRLYTIVGNWQKVPYFHQGYTKGGVDCTGYILNVFLELGIIKEIIPTFHSKDWYFHSPNERLIQEMEKYKIEYSFFPKDTQYQIGDLLLFSSSLFANIHHLGIYLGDNIFTHCIYGTGVINSQLNLMWNKYLMKIARLT